jgi:hypothetical protein
VTLTFTICIYDSPALYPPTRTIPAALKHRRKAEACGRWSRAPITIVPCAKEIRRRRIASLRPDSSLGVREAPHTIIRCALHNEGRRRNNRHIKRVYSTCLLRIPLPTDSHQLNRVLRHPLLCSKLPPCRNVPGGMGLILGHQTTVRHWPRPARESVIGSGDLSSLLLLLPVKWVCAFNGGVEIRLCRESEEL